MTVSLLHFVDDAANLLILTFNQAFLRDNKRGAPDLDRFILLSEFGNILVMSTNYMIFKVFDLGD